MAVINDVGRVRGRKAARGTKLILILLIAAANLVAYIPENGQYVYVAITTVVCLSFPLSHFSQGRIPTTPGGGAVVAILAWFALSVLWSQYLDHSLFNVGWLLALGLTYYVVYLGLRRAGSIRPLSLGIGLSLLSYFVLTLRELGLDLFAVQRYAPLSINENLFARSIMLGVIVVCAALLGPRSRSTKLTLSGGLVLLFWSQVHFTGSRKGFVLTVLVLALFAFHYGRGKSFGKKVVFGVLSALAVFVGVHEVRGTFVWQRTQAVRALRDPMGAEEGSLLVRVERAKRAHALVREKPIAGWGLHQYQYVAGWGDNAYSHSNYIEILVNHGVVGLLMYYSLFLWLLLKYRRNRVNLSVHSRFLFVAMWCTSMLWDVAAVSYQTTSTWVIVASLAFLASNRDVFTGDRGTHGFRNGANGRPVERIGRASGASAHSWS